MILLTVCLSPFLWGMDTGNVLLDRILALLWGNNGEYVSFPFFPWIAFPLLGVWCGEMYMKSSDISQTIKKQMMPAVVVLLCGVGITFTDTSFHMGDYWRTGPGGMLLYLGFIPLWIYICERVSKLLKSKLLDVIIFISKNITVFYIIQWILISSLVALLGQNQSKMLVTVLLQITVTLLTFFFTKWKVGNYSGIKRVYDV